MKISDRCGEKMRKLNEEDKKRVIELEELVAEYEEKIDEIHPKLRIAKNRYESLRAQNMRLWDKKSFYKREIEEITNPKPREPEYLNAEEHPDKENLFGIKMICTSKCRAYSIDLIPVNEMKWTVRQYYVDIEMPADPSDRGSIVLKDGKYHCFNKKRERIVEALDIFYRRVECEEKNSKYLFNGEHKGYE
ncbi:hypothetical protein HN918_01970 [archaeon]|nr:hypothetical protein [archaeon]MBT7192730.1 hypothetical protein [archaeon]